MSSGMRIVLVLVGLVVLWFALTRLGVFSGKRPDFLGHNEGQLAPCPVSPNCVSTQATDVEHAIPPIPYAASPDVARERLLTVITRMPRVKIITQEPDYIYAEFRTGIMMFADDVEFYFDDRAELIQFRSASRLGYSDMGLNRRRMEQIRSAYVTLP